VSKRYYYDDPLAASWMAKHFGMRFETWTGGVPADIGDLGNIYIHPDSLHLLEPQDMDVMEGTGSLDRSFWKMMGVPPEDEGKSYYDSVPARIIQRNGLVFHWPHTEESLSSTTEGK
jgi:hypothetical protein